MGNKQRTALVSVYDKTTIAGFVQQLIELGFVIFSSGGTAKYLREAGLDVLDVASLVGGGPILGHKVVTISRELAAGLLANDSPEEQAELERIKVPRFDLVCVDLYRLQDEIAREGSTRESVIANTDVGGPNMIHAAAKGGRIVVCDPYDRQPVIDWLKSGEQENDFIKGLRAKAEFVVARHVLTSAVYHGRGRFAASMGERIAVFKGENGWQNPAGLFTYKTSDPLALDKFVLKEGAPLSYNNWCDVDRLLQTVTHIAQVYETNRYDDPHIAVGVKHGNSCGVACGINKMEVLFGMIAGDPLAIFGGLVMTNFEVDEALCEPLTGKMLDGIIAPAFTEGAIALLRRKGDKCRFVVNPALGNLAGNLDQAPRFRYVRGGFLTQPNYTFVPNFGDGQVVKHARATPRQEIDMLLAWAIGSTSNSNTITLVKNEQLIGNGVGQQDRVGAAKLAIARAERSGHDVKGAVAYSDSFFPFPDGPQALIDAGVSAIFTSSGSKRDQETINVCAKHGVVLYMVPDALGRGFFGH